MEVFSSVVTEDKLKISTNIKYSGTIIKFLDVVLTCTIMLIIKKIIDAL